MRKIFLIAIAAISYCAMPPIAPAHKQSSEYQTLFILQWVYECSEKLKVQYTNRGTPHHYALQMSIQNCSCMIDNYRTNFTQPEVVNMSYQDRTYFGEEYAKICLNIITES
tara:strand:+ start:196 stop:528 length:333 start_codon:yes stop_codon:yes gene_type:complete